MRGLFFLNGSGHVPMAFVQALAALEYRPVLLSGPSDVKVVDVAIARTLEALDERGGGDVLLASHDGDFAEPVAALLRRGGAASACSPSASSSAAPSCSSPARASRSSTSRTTSGRSRSRSRASG